MVEECPEVTTATGAGSVEGSIEMAESSTRTVERALSLLAAVCTGGRVTSAACAREVNLSPSTTMRLLRTLESTGFVSRDDDGMYGPGPRLVQLGTLALSQESLVGICNAEMTSLSEATGESVYLSVFGHRDTALYIAIVEGTHSIRHTSWVGRTIPLEGTAAGQVLTDRVPDDGYVVIERGLEPDVTAIAAPVRSGDRVVAALSLIVPSYRLNSAAAHGLGRELTRRVAKLTAELGGKAKTEVSRYSQPA